jgi:glycosyltransferase involved in cell wall biosynthesis
MDLSIVIPWLDRFELSKTLPLNLTYLDEQEVRFELIIVNVNGNLEKLKEIVKKSNHSAVKMATISLESFSKSQALNHGIQLAEGKYFMCLDTDVMIKNLDLQSVFSQINKGCFVTIKTVEETNKSPNPVEKLPFDVGGITAISYKIDLEREGQESISVVLNRQNLKKGDRSGPGIIIVSMADLKEAGGYNGELIGWGWEDIDLIVRLEVLGKKRRQQGTVMHITHGEDMRNLTNGVGSKSENEVLNMQKCLINYQLGLFKGTLNVNQKEID